MKQHLWKSLAVSALVMTLGFESSGHAETADTDRALDNLSASAAQTARKDNTLEEPATLVAETEEIEVEADRAPVEAIEPAKQSQQSKAKPTKIYPHLMDGKLAATLYVRDIPVLTFLGDTLQVPPTDTPDAAPASLPNLSETEPMRAAEALADKLGEWVRTEDDAKAIALRWDEDEEYYRIEANKQTLIVLDNGAMLPDTTGNETQDAVQVTNRLRRLLGNAPPVSEIYGKPAIAPSKPASSSSSSPEQPAAVKAISGWASWYGPGFHGNLTANGEIYDQYALTAAHRTLPFGTKVRVTNMDNGRVIVLRINDRGPYVRNRVIDLSKAAAQHLGLMQSGVAPVRVEILK
ncbi:septal ring lytic transglycosylase RlpA family protein [Roseofilum casamattae]|uniref:Probable endolytic peptidoglycan transglycosylase RlpA n=1 Tax=Roseofilum casamattae BLCC-M143 TaxID=3022442 RepID=A0ABT7BYU3_9CYAN|nr:septal ring lytic transglycosylase RlpA family protein [Roseofilum casamattae]MDJ1184376.1 septal ring lytic transglycosylase RlpA family protein [Roseofilum casamattae BLCC-M143]